MASGRESSPKSLVTEEDVKAALKADKGINARLTSWTIEDFTRKGDNYATFVTSVKIGFSLEGSLEETSYVLKLNPQRHPDFKDADNLRRLLFTKEAGFYTDILPLLSHELTTVGMQALRIPKCFYSSLTLNHEMLFLEDLRPKGFKMRARQKSMDPLHTNLVLRELARLHASSTLLQTKDGVNELADKHEYLKKSWTDFGDTAYFLFSSRMSYAMDMLHKVGGYEDAEKWLQDHKDDPFRIFQKQLTRKKPFDVVCHGDCWSNNFLFKYNDEGYPVDVMLVDLQLSTVASPATDINYLLYSSLDGDVRKDNLKDFLASYHDSFRNVMQAGGEVMPFSLKELQQEYRNRLEFGLMTGIPAIFVVLDEEDATAQTSSSSEDAQSVKTFSAEKAMKMLDEIPLVKPRFLAIFDDMIEAGVIS